MAAGLPSKVLILTTFDLDDYVYAGLRAGASGFLLKDTQPAHLVAAIHTIAAGDAVLAPGATNRLVRQFATQPPEPSSSQRAAEIRQALTGREQEVFTHIATGQSNSEIAATLFLSEGTVKIHVGRILAKLGLRDRVQAVVLAYESRLISPRPAPAVISAVIRTACRGGADDRPEPRPARCGGRPGPRSTFRSIPRAPQRAP